MRVTTRSPEETRAFGRSVGAALKGPMILLLNGELGSGKTVFVQGLAEGLEIPGATEVTSPSFALIHEHQGRLPLFHVDLYRLERETDLDGLGLEEILESRAVVAVEWGERLPPRGIRDHVSVSFEIVSDTERGIVLTGKGASAKTILGSIPLFRD